MPLQVSLLYVLSSAVAFVGKPCAGHVKLRVQQNHQDLPVKGPRGEHACGREFAGADLA